MSLANAIKVAQANPIKCLPKMAALIYDGKRLVSVGMNQRKSHPLQHKYRKDDHKIYLHAEIAAIAAVRGSVEGMTIYIARVNNRGEARLAKPCSGCEKAILAFGFKRVIWTK